jgi:UDP-glucose 4-epimerase
VKLLVTGGAGYIGAHVSFSLLAAGYEIVILDDFSTGVKERLDDLNHSQVKEGDIRDLPMLESLFRANKFDGVIHLAGKKSVSESFHMKDEYEMVNVIGTNHLISLSKKYDVAFFIFASSAAVYDSDYRGGLILESSSLKPLSPYGKTKLQAEYVLNDVSKEAQTRILSLRFFNVVGSQSEIFADSSKETLLPKIETCIRSKEPLVIYGTNLPTPDGTCIRDYVHVEDVASAILCASQILHKGEKHISKVLNLGTGIGHSVQEVVSVYRQRIDLNLRVLQGDRRDGDPIMAVCDPTLAFQELGWKAKVSPFRDVTSDRFIGGI